MTIHFLGIVDVNKHINIIVNVTSVTFFIFQLRNKPKEPPKKPKAAPFFLPSVPGLETKFDIQKDDEKIEVSLTFF